MDMYIGRSTADEDILINETKALSALLHCCNMSGFSFINERKVLKGC